MKPKVEEKLEEPKNLGVGGHSSLRDSLRESTNSNSLIDKYLKGKITMGELAFELRKLNSVQADSIIKEGKQSMTAAVDYKEVPRADMSKPGADLNPNEEYQPKAKTVAEAKHQARDTDDHKAKKEAENQEAKLQAQQTQMRVREVVNFIKDKEVKSDRHNNNVETKKKVEEFLEQQTQDETPISPKKSSRFTKLLTSSIKKIKSIIKELLKRRSGASAQGR